MKVLFGWFMLVVVVGTVLVFGRRPPEAEIVPVPVSQQEKEAAAASGVAGPAAVTATWSSKHPVYWTTEERQRNGMFR